MKEDLAFKNNVEICDEKFFTNGKKCIMISNKEVNFIQTIYSKKFFRKNYFVCSKKVLKRKR